MYVHGEPGIGKSALVDAFLAELRREHDIELLAGREERFARLGSDAMTAPLTITIAS